MVKIIVKDLVKSYGERGRNIKVLNGIAFKANHGEFVCLLGPSGCGKTTILNIIAGLIQDYNGKVIFEDKTGKIKNDVKIGYVFQTPRLLNWRTLKENVIFALKASLSNKNNIKNVGEIAEKYLKLVDLQDSVNKYPLACSEGERTRASIARALSIDPDLLLMDEPFSHLDEITARKLRKELLKIWSERRKTVIFVTHNALEAVYLADKIFILSDKPTTIIGEVKIDLERPREFEDVRLLEYQKKVLRRMGI